MAEFPTITQLSTGGEDDKWETEPIVHTTGTAQMLHGENSYSFEVSSASVATGLNCMGVCMHVHKVQILNYKCYTFQFLFILSYN